MSDCLERIDRFLRRDLGRWTGLDTACTAADVAQLPFAEGQGVARLGTSNVEYLFRVLRHAGLDEGVTFYFDGDALRVIETEYWSLDAVRCGALLKELGEPSQRVDLQWRDRRIDGAELVFADRGLAIGVLPETGVIVRVAGFAPCPLETYRDRYYHAALAREFRSRG